MRRLITACCASLALYWAMFGLVAARPLSTGALRLMLDAKYQAAAVTPSPKLVILAGSNGLYSHRCETIAAILNRPCVNVSSVIGVGLDYQIARLSPLLHQGDIVYLPMEEAQYTRTQAESDSGPDAAILFRYQHALWWHMPPRRRLAAAFAFNLRAAVMSLAEPVLAKAGIHPPMMEINAEGDRIGHTEALATQYRARLADFAPVHPNEAAINQGYGSHLLAMATVTWQAQGVTVVGGVPVGFTDSTIPAPSLAAISRAYTENGGQFLALPGLSRYPRTAFFDSADHLAEPAQITQSQAVAIGLRALKMPPTTYSAR